MSLDALRALREEPEEESPTLKRLRALRAAPATRPEAPARPLTAADEQARGSWWASPDQADYGPAAAAPRDNDLFGYGIRDPYPDEQDFFASHPEVTGMAADDGAIVLNPQSPPGVNRAAVARNEALRLYLRDKQLRPQFAVTARQKAYFAGTPYEKDPEAMRATILGRIYSGDPSMGDVTAEQRQVLDEVLQQAAALTRPQVGQHRLVQGPGPPEPEEESPTLKRLRALRAAPETRPEAPARAVRADAPLTSWVPPELYQQWSRQGPIGAFEQAGREVSVEGAAKNFPFSPVGPAEHARAWAAAERLQANDYRQFLPPGYRQTQRRLAMYGIEPNYKPGERFEREAQAGQAASQAARQADLEELGQYFLKQEEARTRGYTVGGRIVQGGAALPGYVLEFLATGGGASLAKEAIGKASGKLLGKAAEKGVGKLATKAAQWTAGGVARTALMPHRVVESMAQRALPRDWTLTDKGELIVREEGERPLTALWKGFGNVVIENMSEEAGGALGKAGKKVLAGPGRAVGKVLPKRLSGALAAAFKRLHPGEKVEKLFTEAGYHGFLEEIGEERLGDLMRAATGVEDFGAGPDAGVIDRLAASAPGGKELLVEAGVIAPLSLLRAGTALRTAPQSQRMGKAPPPESPPTGLLTGPAPQPAAGPPPIPPGTTPPPEAASKTLSPTERLVEEQIVRKPAAVSVWDWVKSLPATFQRQWVNELSVMERGLKKAGLQLDPRKPGGLRPDLNPVELATMYKGKPGGQARGWAIYHTTDIYGRPNGEALMDIIAPVAPNNKTWEKFSRYHYARVAQNRWRLGNNPGITKQQADTLVNELDNPEWRAVSDRVTQWHYRALDYLQEATAISAQENTAIKKAHPVYASLVRDIAGQGVPGPPGRYVKTGKGLERLKEGGDLPVIDWLQNGLSLVKREIGIANRVKVTTALADLLAQNPALEEMGFMKKVIRPLETVQAKAQEITARMGEAALSPETPLIFSQAVKEVHGRDVVPIIRQGKTEFYKVNKELQSVLENLEEVRLPAFLDWILGKPARLRRLGATGLSSTFGLATNPWRDTWTAFMTAEHAQLGPLSTTEGLFEDLRDIWAHQPRKPTIAEQYKAMGGEMSMGVGHDRISTAKASKELLQKARGHQGVLYYDAQHPIQAARALFSVSELAPRVAEFKHAKAYGEKQWGAGSAAAQVYGFNAGQDLTLNFTRSGSRGRWLNSITPFYNAGVQGPSKIYRTVKKHPVSFVLKGIGTMTAASLLLWRENRDEEWYQNLPAREKAEFWYVPIPGTETATGEPIVIRLPVPWEVGYVFKSLPEMYFDSRYREDPESFDETFQWMFKRMLPPLLPVGLDIAMHVAQNEDWLGRPIEPKYSEENLLRKDRDKPYTTRLMKELARLTYDFQSLWSGRPTGLSPAMMDYVANSLTGSLYGRTVQPLEKAAGLGHQKEWTRQDLPVIGRLIAREPYAPRRKIEQFYQEWENLKQQQGSEKKAEGRPTWNTRVRARRYQKASQRLSKFWDLLNETEEPQERKELYRRLELTIDRARQDR